ncbi:uncharacterized protein I303_106330 [Kwoniella dejecticola CBS 10117]|uniref:Uncharacterized protein n=1 Tax=Kwoniella dejecticola CBS 10117 TaxID=1296121 RepID=A0AAJ8KUI3_9TREE
MTSFPRSAWHKARDVALLVCASLIALEMAGWDLRTNFGLDSFRNPYLLPGFLVYSQKSPHENRWSPFNGSSSPALLASLLRSSWHTTSSSISSDILRPENWWKEHLGPDGQGWEDISWARGKTVLVVGDSVGRFQVRYFCEMAGEPLRELNWDHPFSPPEILHEELVNSQAEVTVDLQTEKKHNQRSSPSWHRLDRQPKRPTDAPLGQKAVSGDSPLVGRDDDTRHEGNGTGFHGHYCHVPGVDLMIVQVFNYGLDQSGFWTFREDYIPPYTIESRISLLASPYITAMGRAKTAPELTYIGSALWDTTRWMREDAAQGRDISHPVSRERLLWYRSRIREVLIHTRKVFPKTVIKWSSHHYPLRSMAGWFFDGGKQDERPRRPQQRLNRLWPLHQAALSATTDFSDVSLADFIALRGITVNMWGKLMMGMEDHQRDDLHHRLLPGGYLWADMMLFDLREAVNQKRWS